MRTGIVTGATGFIGEALCRELMDNGRNVVAVVRPNSEKKYKLTLLQQEKKYASRFSIIELSLDELEKIHTDFRIEADEFYHLAWNGAGGSARDDFETQYSNIAYTARALQTAKACGCKKFIGAGSQAEYGVVRGVAKEDETVPHPFMMYGAAKLATYQMCQVLAKQLEIKLVWSRIYSVYGIGENKGTLVSYVIDTLKKGEIPQLSSCENMWNFLYITDCVRVLRVLGECEETEGIYHVASKDTRLLKDFVKEIRDIVAPGTELGFGVNQSNPERTFWLEPDVGKISKIGFVQYRSFQDGIKEESER